MPASHDTTSERSSFDTVAWGGVLAKFEGAWERGERPAIEAFLPADPVARRAALQHLLHIDLERRLKAGEAVRVEHYRERFPELGEDRGVLLGLIEAECDLRHRRAAVAVEEYVRRFPDFRGELESRLPPLLAAPAATAAHPGPAQAPPVPEQFGRYRIVRVLGQGNMGTVYLAHDTHLEREVALKVPHRAGADSQLATRFAREARAAAHLHHPNLCPVYDAGEINGVPFLTMAYIKGLPLTQAFPPPLPQRQAAELVRQLARALEEAHKAGVVHRDLKPANVLVREGGEPVVMDFGLARRVLPDEARATTPGLVLGSPAYMSPEQATGDADAQGPACDVYSLGVVLYELLTGRVPFQGSVVSVLAQVATAEPPPPGQWRADLDPGLEEICQRAMAKRLGQRYASMGEFAAALSAWLAGTAEPAPAPAAAPAEALVDPRVADDVLRLLHDWGWDMGLERLKAAIAEAGDGPRRAALQVLLGWLAGERGHYGEALEQFRAAEANSPLAGWALAGRAFVAMRERDLGGARDLLARAAAAGPQDGALQATVAHGRGTLAYHESRTAEALAELNAALERLGPNHFGTGRVLDTLGMVYASRDHFPAACQLYAASLAAKRRFGDEAGVALTHGQLGRLHLDWGRLDEADEHFRQGLELCRRIGDERGEAQLYNHRGQVLLARGRPAEAASLLDESIRSATGRWPVLEGFARKDRALAHLAVGEPAQADTEATQAVALFQAARFASGAAHVQQVRGLIRHAQKQYAEAARLLRTAAAHFGQRGERAEAARVLVHLARTLRAQAAAAPVVAEASVAALDAAERARRGNLVADIEQELQGVAEPELVRRAGRRVRGPEVPQNTDLAGVREEVTVLALALRADAEEDQAGLLQRNYLWADLEETLEGCGVAATQYQGDGLLAVVRGRDHARRAVAAALAAAEALAQYNRPRRVLGWPLWQIQVGVGSGPAWVGNIGTFRKLDFTAVGSPVQEAAALRDEAEPGVPCVGEATFQLVSNLFAFKPGGPRKVPQKGQGPRRAWDVVAARSAGGSATL